METIWDFEGKSPGMESAVAQDEPPDPKAPANAAPNYCCHMPPKIAQKAVIVSSASSCCPLFTLLNKLGSMKYPVSMSSMIEKDFLFC